MRLAALVQSQDRSMNIDERKRVQQNQRKEAEGAYKKTAQYFSPKKNSALAELEGLLLGKKDKEVYNEQKSTTSQEQQQIFKLQQAEKDVIAHEMAHKAAGGAVTGPASYEHTEGPDGKHYVTAGEVQVNAPAGSTEEETLKILETVRRAALAPAQPSPQDLRVAASASAQIEQTKAQLQGNDYNAEETPAFLEEPIEVTIPQRFEQEIIRDANEDTVFGNKLAEFTRGQRFAQAKASYASMQTMVSNGYRVGIEPSFSLTA